MEHQWERLDPVQLSVDEANARLVGSGFRVSALDLIPEGLANTNFRATLEGGEFVLLRLYQRDHEASGRLERAVSDRWSGSLPIPRLHWLSDDGSLSVSEWVSGRTLAQMIQGQEWASVVTSAVSVGEALAQVHRVRLDHGGFLSPQLEVETPWPSVYDGYFGYIRALCGNALVLERAACGVVDDIQRELDDFDRWARPHFDAVSLTHGDYKPTNLLVDGTSLSAVLDWEFVHAGSIFLDLGIFLRYAHQWPPAVTDGLLEGLHRGGVELPAEWRKISQTVDFLSLLDFLSRPGSGPTTIATVNELLERSLRELRGANG